MLSSEQVLERFAKIRQAPIAGGQRAPHKPLFLLYLLGVVQRGEPGGSGPVRLRYVEADQFISPLIDAFGPPSRQRHRAAMPFYYLDPSLWLLAREGLQPRDGVLRGRDACGEMDPEVVAALRGDPSLLTRIAWRLLVTNFPETYHAPICTAVGLDLAASVAEAATRRRVRSAEFRTRVIRAYEHTCAFCGYRGMTARPGGTDLQPVGMAAAHVRWYAYDGPDDPGNGLALCDLHHTLFDYGMLGVDEQRGVMVSPCFVAHDERARALVRGLELRAPRDIRDAVAEEHFAWHRQQVYRAE